MLLCLSKLIDNGKIYDFTRPLQYQLKMTRNTRDCIVLHGGLFNMWLCVKLCIPLHLSEHNGSLRMTVDITKCLSMQVGGFHK